MDVCNFDYRHTVLPTAIKRWHNFPGVTIYLILMPFFYFSLRLVGLCKFEEQLLFIKKNNKQTKEVEIVFLFWQKKNYRTNNFLPKK